MTNRKSTKKALLMSALSLLLCFSMLVGTTFAWFTDEVKSGTNQIIAGNLDVEVYHGDASLKQSITEKNVLFDEIKLWEPGVVAYENITVVNEGNLALKYQMFVNFDNENTLNGLGLSKVLRVAVVPDGIDKDATREEVLAAAGEGVLLSELTEKGELLEHGASKAYGIVIWWEPSEHDNFWNVNNGDKVSDYTDEASNYLHINLGIKLVATQLNAESDSFGPDYDEDAWHREMKVYSAQDLQAAINNGEKNIVLMDNITLTESIVIPAAPTTYSLRNATPAVVIDLNDKTIAGIGRNDEGKVHTLINNGNLYLKNGTVKTAGNDGGSAIYNAEGATLVLEDVTALGAPQANNVYPDSTKAYPSYAINNYGDLIVNGAIVKSYHGAIATGGNGTAVINDVTIDVGMGNSTGITSYAIYAFENGQVTINGGNFAFTKQEVYVNGGNMFCELGSNPIVINGGNFVGGGFSQGDGREYVINGGTFSFDTTKYVADGYKAVQNADGTYTVIFPQESFDKLIDNAGENATIEIPAGEYTFPASKLEAGMTLNCAPGTVFEGKSAMNINGATVIGATFSNPDDVAGAGTINGTFKDCVFEGSEALRWCYAGETVVFENCEFKTDFRGVHFDGMDHDVIFRNCKINGFNAFGGTATVTFEGCTFGYDESRYNGLNMYCNTVLKDCKFEYVSGKTNFIDFEEADHDLTITNCTATLNGETANVLDFVGGTYKNQTHITVDGAPVVATSEELNTAISGGADTVYLASGNYSLRFTNNTSFNVDDMTIIGVGSATLSISSSEVWYGRIQGSNVTFENITFTGNVGATGKATYNNCTINYLECASSGNAETYVNNCTLVQIHTSTDFSAGNAYVKDSTITKAEYSGTATMYFENCTIGELISWNMNTVLTNCTVTTLDDSHMTTNTIVVN